jgi:hypothetical protein
VNLLVRKPNIELAIEVTLVSFLSKFNWIYNMNNTTGVARGAGTAYHKMYNIYK